jgi:hypothetical protein
VWDPHRGTLVRVLEGHAHWVNTLALNTDYAIRTGPYDYKGNRPQDEKEGKFPFLVCCLFYLFKFLLLLLGMYLSNFIYYFCVQLSKLH